MDVFLKLGLTPNQLLAMTNFGKSDVFEALIQVFLLKLIQQHGRVTRQTVIREMRRLTDGQIPLTTAAVSIGLAKLESSGWIFLGKSGVRSDQDKFELTATAATHLSEEFHQWRLFVESWPGISLLLKKVIVE